LGLTRSSSGSLRIFLPLGGTRGIWENKIKVDLKTELYHVECIHVAEDNDKWQAVTNTIMISGRL